MYLGKRIQNLNQTKLCKYKTNKLILGKLKIIASLKITMPGYNGMCLQLRRPRQKNPLSPESQAW
jgi:hypothetical protein